MSDSELATGLNDAYPERLHAAVDIGGISMADDTSPGNKSADHARDDVLRDMLKRSPQHHKDMPKKGARPAAVEPISNGSEDLLDQSKKRSR